MSKSFAVSGSSKMIVHDIYVNVKLQGTLLISVKFCPPSRQVKLSFVLALKTVSFIYLHIFRLVVRIDRKPCGLRGGESRVVAVVPLYRAAASVSRKLGVSFLQRIIYIFDNSLEFIQNTQKTKEKMVQGQWLVCIRHQ